MKNQTATRKKSIRFFCLTLAILMFSSICIWGFQTSWGDVTIKRLTLMGDNGTKISTLVYIPKTATSDNPAPCTIIYHGRSNQGHSNDTWSMELARRGYVVFSPDLSGGGESDVNDRTPQAIDVAKYANSLDIVIPDKINIIGYSLGCNTVGFVYQAMSEKINSVLYVFGPFMVSMTEEQLEEGCYPNMTANVGIIKAMADQYDFNFIGNPEACLDKMVQIFGVDSKVEADKDYEINGKLFRYMEVTGALHQTGNISGEAIDKIIQYTGDVAKAPIEREISDQAWIGQQIFSGIAAVDMMFLLAALISLFLENEFFASIKNERPVKKEQKGIKAWAIDILFSFLIPALIFIPVSAYGMGWFANSKILTSTNLNGIMLWLVALAIIGIIRSLIRVNKRRKNGEKIRISDFALGAEHEKSIKWSNVAKSLLLGIVVTCIFGLIMTALEDYFGINYQLWNIATYLKPSATRIIRSIPYMIIIFTVMFVGNTNQRTLPSFGSERKDMVAAVAVNTILTALALAVLLTIQYGGSLAIGTGQPVFAQMTIPGVKGGTSVGALDFAFGYCYMMGGTTGVVTYIYRKYGNIWAGVIPCAIFAGLFTTLGFTLVC